VSSVAVFSFLQQLSSFVADLLCKPYPAKGSPTRNTCKMPVSPEQLLLQLFVVFVAAKLLGELFERLRLPAVPGEILAGVALGPYAIAVIPASDTLHSIAELGAIFVLFSAGLETSPHELIQVSRKALRTS
jgi:Kef-type K+ transport system membrane component KefB